MRTVRLARVAAQAELLLVRRLATVFARRAAYGAVAAVFGLAMLALLHVLIIDALEQFAHLSPLVSTLIVFVLDLVVAGVFAMMATGKMPDPIAEEARRVRDQSLEQARQSLTFAAMLAPATRAITQTGLLRVLVRAAGSGLRRSKA